MDRLFAYLHHAAARPYEWGHSDCMLFMADWVALATGSDPAADLRDTYGDPAVCPIGRGYRNDPLPVCARAFADLAPAADPVRGDVAVGLLRGQRFLCGAICIGGGWVIRVDAPTGLLFVKGRFDPRKAWSVPHAA
jgi:hypothetical protein